MPVTYEEPTWSGVPKENFFLEVLKGGIIIDNIPLKDRSFFVFGRQPDIVDFHLEHPSISREHAVLQFGQSGISLHLFDCESRHGTFVNKQRILPKKYETINVGDVIRFGESTRLYIVCGPEALIPEEYDSKNMQEYRVKLKLRTQSAESKKEKEKVEENSSDATWGFDEDAENESDERGNESDDSETLPGYLKTENERMKKRNLSVGINEDSVHEKDRKSFTKLQQKLKKIENLHSENDRINAKEMSQGGLTAGQQEQVARNMERITSLRAQVEEMEDSIRQKNIQRQGSIVKNNKDEIDITYENDSGDEFYDRTLSTCKKSAHTESQDNRKRTARVIKSILTVSKTETYESLKKEQKELQNQLSNVIAELNSIENDVSDNETQEELDPLDAFFRSNERDSKEERRKTLIRERDNIEAALRKNGALIKLVQPSLPMLKQENSIATTTGLATGFNVTTRKDESKMPKSKRVKWAETLEEQKIIENRTASDENKPHSENPFIEAASKWKTKYMSSLDEPIKEGQKSARTEFTSNSALDIDAEIGRVETWLPPRGQTGDGRTDLNSKFGY